jgi:ElaB/YqjD/DUF883 family membrane-anchored ribosome-binding protein
MENQASNSDFQDSKAKPTAFQSLKDRLENLKNWVQKAHQDLGTATEKAKDKISSLSQEALEKIDQTKQNVNELGESLLARAAYAKEQAEIFLLESSRSVHQNTSEFLGRLALPKLYYGVVETHFEYVAQQIGEQAKGAFYDKSDEWLISVVDSVYEFMPLPVRLVFRRENFRALCLTQKARLFKLAAEFYNPPAQLPPSTEPS